MSPHCHVFVTVRRYCVRSMRFLWIIQDSDGKHFNWTELHYAVSYMGSNAVYVPINLISEYKIEKDILPIVIGGDDYLFYAVKNIKLKKGVFLAPEFFNVNCYMKIWKNRYLNWDAKFVKSKDISGIVPPFFIRPMQDNKYIDGQVVSSRIMLREIQSMFVKESNQIFCVSSVKKLGREWRAIIVQNKVISVCRYAINSETSVSSVDVPDKVMSFIRENCQIIGAPIAWVMDVAEYQNELFILECNIFNASNFYDCDRIEIVSAVENALRYLTKKV